MLGYARILNTTRGDIHENPLQAGELVQLRSGGPLMVVNENNEVEELVRVTWHDRSGVVHTELFAPELLQRSRRSFFWRRR